MSQHTAARIAKRTKFASMRMFLSLGKEATNMIRLAGGLTPGSELDARPLDTVTQNVPGCRSVTLHNPSDGTLPHKRHTASQTLSQVVSPETPSDARRLSPRRPSKANNAKVGPRVPAVS